MYHYIFLFLIWSPLSSNKMKKYLIYLIFSNYHYSDEFGAGNHVHILKHVVVSLLIETFRFEDEIKLRVRDLKGL